MLQLALKPTLVQFGYSPLWETVAYARASLHSTSEPFFICAREEITRKQFPALALLTSPSGYMPDFLAPPPRLPTPTFQQELESFLETPADVVGNEIARMRRDIRRHDLLQSPPLLLAAVADELRRVWNQAVGPIWERIQAVLDGDVLRCGRQLALEGPELVLAALHPAIRFSRGSVRIQSGPEHRSANVEGPLLLVPSAFAWPHVFAVLDRPWRPSVYYPASGSGNLCANSVPSTALVALAGAARARLLRALAAPKTTDQLSRQLGQAPSTVSEQLGRLARAGVVERVRVGRRVFYNISPFARHLVSNRNIGNKVNRR